MPSHALLGILIVVSALFTATSGQTSQPAEKLKSTTQPEMPKELTLDLGNKVTMKLVLIPAGKFLMGSPDAEQREAAKAMAAAVGVTEEEARKLIASEGPQHEVTISRCFYMGIYEVTQGQWKTIMGTTLAEQRDKANKSLSFYGEGDDHPMCFVSWWEATDFCKKLSHKTGKAVRLPTEAEWEYACRAGTKTPFNTGETISTDQANYNGNYVYGNGVKGEYRRKTTPVGSFQPNAWGLYDMHGNVDEWCADWYGYDYYSTTKELDPQGPNDGMERVVRGGCWRLDPERCRSAHRFWFHPAHRIVIIGFRVVLDLK